MLWKYFRCIEINFPYIVGNENQGFVHVSQTLYPWTPPPVQRFTEICKDTGFDFVQVKCIFSQNNTSILLFFSNYQSPVPVPSFWMHQAISKWK